MSFNYALNFSYLTLAGIGGVPTSTISAAGAITVKFYPIWYKQVTMEWSVPAVWGSCTFNVYKGPTEDGPFEKLNINPLTTNYFKDTHTQSFSKFNRDFYIVEAIISPGQAIRSPASSWEKLRRRDVELKALDIQRREYLLLSKYTGVETMVFKRKTYGARCTKCWNPDTERMMNDKCTECLGTSFSGGFFPGVKTFVQYETTQNNTSLTYFGKFEPNQMGAWTISYPELDSFDIIVRLPDWKAYRVEKVMPTELLTVTVRQILQLTELDKESIEYNLITRDTSVFPANYVN